MITTGIDLGVHKIAMFTLRGDLPWDARTYEAPYDHPRDLQLRELAGVAHEWCVLHSVDEIWVEDVLLGNNHKYSLALAEVKGALLSHLGQLRSSGADVRTVNVARWKKHVVSKGNATKDEVKNYIDVTHPSYAPFCDGDQDRYDAACVALYGLQIHDKADQLSAGRLVEAD